MVDMARGGIAIILFVLLSLSLMTVDSAIFSKKKRRDVPEKLEAFSDNSRSGEGAGLHRHKRVAQTTATPVQTTDPPPGSEGKLLFNDTVLNGSEGHSVRRVRWSRNETNNVVFILTVKYNISGIEDSQIWRSEDYGRSFRNMSLDKDESFSYFYVSPVDSKKMVFTDMTNKLMYTTTNELRTHKKVSLPAASDEIYMHHTNSDWMLLYDFYERHLYVTMNFGTTWTLLHKDVNYNFDWGVKGFDDPHIVHMEIEPHDAEQAYYARCTIPHCNASGDGINYSLGPFLTYSLLVDNEYIFVQKAHQNGKDSHMMVSHGRNQFTNTYFPDNVKTQDFLILDTSEGQVFLAVNHGNRMGVSLYLSDPTGRYYVLSLSSVHHRSFGNTWFDVDMHRVKGLNGTYLANQQLKNDKKKVRSLISYNKGGSWVEIASPKAKTCTSDNCSLVLRLDMDSYFHNWILSEENAPGFLIAHGHYGRDSGQNLTVFTSIDGGWRWNESQIMQGVYHFNILDQGSVITAIKVGYHVNSSQVYYSYNEGRQWHKEQFVNKTMYVRGVLSDPNIKTVVIGVYGHMNSSAPWNVVTMNFSMVLNKKCDDSKDYTNWMPSDHDNNLNENCVLGQQVTYKRKLPGSVCFNGEDFERTVSKILCNCTDEDFECDFGYAREGNDCKKQAWFNDSYVAPECTEHQTYSKSKGYRKVGSDKCVGGVATSSKYQMDTSATCPLVKPDQLILVSNVTVVAARKPVLFHLIQKRGSVHTTQYLWNFSDTRNVTVTGLQKAQHQVHNFTRAGLYDIKVTATNDKGASSSNVIRIQVEYPVRSVSVLYTWATRVGLPVVVSASTNIWQRNSVGGLHYMYRFGDEANDQKDVLSWASNVTHTYSRAGTFTLTVTAVNRISAFTKQVQIAVIDDGVLAQLTFSSNVDRFFGHPNSFYYYERVFIWLEGFRQEITMILGVSLDRLALSLNSSYPTRIDALILPKPASAPDSEMTDAQIAQTFIDMVGNQTFSLFKTTGFPTSFGDINVTSVVILDYNGGNNGSSNSSGHHGGGDKDSGINYRAIYIAVPVVVVAGFITVIVVICYRRRSRTLRYSLMNQDGAADPFFDEDDELPLDMSDARDTGRSNDDDMLDLRSGGQLVMVTGNGEEA